MQKYFVFYNTVLTENSEEPIKKEIGSLKKKLTALEARKVEIEAAIEK